MGGLAVLVFLLGGATFVLYAAAKVVGAILGAIGSLFLPGPSRQPAPVRPARRPRGGTAYPARGGSQESERRFARLEGGGRHDRGGTAWNEDRDRLW